jgi:hypothetical protein
MFIFNDFCIKTGKFGPTSRTLEGCEVTASATCSQKKLKLKGRRFDITQETYAESQRVLDTLTEKDFQEAFQKWRQWVLCLLAGGKYFEGDGGR